MSTSVFAHLDTRIHQIEVENTAEGFCRYADAGKTGHVFVTTAEVPGVDLRSLRGAGSGYRVDEIGRALPPGDAGVTHLTTRLAAVLKWCG